MEKDFGGYPLKIIFDDHTTESKMQDCWFTRTIRIWVQEAGQYVDLQAQGRQQSVVQDGSAPDRERKAQSKDQRLPPEAVKAANVATEYAAYGISSVKISWN